MTTSESDSMQVMEAQSMRRTVSAALGMLLVFGWSPAQSGVKTDVPAVAAVPESFFNWIRETDREAARQFYTKYIDVKGLPVAASAEVADMALQRTYEIVTHMLAGRPDVLQAMVERGMYLIIIGRDQVYTDMPEYRNSRNPEFQNERVRGTGGLPTSFGEENLLSLPLDRYDDESIGVHEFCHTIDSTLGRIDPTWRDRKNAAYRNAGREGALLQHVRRLATPASTGPRSPRRTSTATGSTTGIMGPSATASSSRHTIRWATSCVEPHSI